MIDVTPEAAAQVLESARRAGIARPRLRIAARRDAADRIEYGMGFDDGAEGDLEFSSAGVTLVVAPSAAPLLEGARLDYVEFAPGEHRFIVLNPNDPSHQAPKP